MKKISLLILTFLCSLLMTVPVWADDTGYIRDTIGYLEAYEEETLETEAASMLKPMVIKPTLSSWIVT